MIVFKEIMTTHITDTTEAKITRIAMTDIKIRVNRKVVVGTIQKMIILDRTPEVDIQIVRKVRIILDPDMTIIIKADIKLDLPIDLHTKTIQAIGITSDQGIDLDLNPHEVPLNDTTVPIDLYPDQKIRDPNQENFHMIDNKTEKIK